MNTKIIKLLIIAFVGCIQLSFSQKQTPNQSTKAPKIPLDSATKLITYQEIVKSKFTKTQLYRRAIEWVSANFVNSQEATNIRDENNGILEGKYRFKIYNFDKAGNKIASGVVEYSFKIEIKDNKYRYTFTKYNIKANSYTPIEKWFDKNAKSYSPLYETYLAQVDEYTRDLIAKLKKLMEKPEEQKKDNF
ncbi:MAG: DUF4468 domain-containing protein [Bacteroidales bacterium]|nr:DUF4468 domain-containing protein [Bacteroidales bacterium]